MARKNTKKAETPSPVKVAGKASRISASVTIRVIKAHDGLEVGETYIKPRETAYMMREAGFWEII